MNITLHEIPFKHTLSNINCLCQQKHENSGKQNGPHVSDTPVADRTDVGDRR